VRVDNERAHAGVSEVPCSQKLEQSSPRAVRRPWRVALIITPPPGDPALPPASRKKMAHFRLFLAVRSASGAPPLVQSRCTMRSQGLVEKVLRSHGPTLRETCAP
jgi:hypothetical protein